MKCSKLTAHSHHPAPTQRNTFKYHRSVHVSIYAHSRPTYYNALQKTSQLKPYWLSTRLGPQPTLSVCGNICDANGDVWRALGGFDFPLHEPPSPPTDTHTLSGLALSLSPVFCYLLENHEYSSHLATAIWGSYRSWITSCITSFRRLIEGWFGMFFSSLRKVFCSHKKNSWII